MTGLQEERQYSLSNENKSRKSLIFVKLTDSAIQSIETFLNSKDDSSSKPTIQFQDNNGVISLPLNGRPHTYGFTLSNVEGGGGLQSSFQCLQHTDDSSLESLGFMLMKMQIHATEDSYEKTKCKMTAADQEQKNLCTKELHQTVSRLGNKVSVKRPGQMCITAKTLSSVMKPEPTKVISKSRITSHGNLAQQPIRQRIIQILAAKSYKKAELLLRLKREGINDKDKDQINDILVKVATLKGNIITLENNIWKEVEEDWEFSSQDELDLIKKKKQQFLKNISGVTGLSKPPVKQCTVGSRLPILSGLDKKRFSLIKKDKSSTEKNPHVNGQGYMSAEKPGLATNGTLHASKTLSAIAGNIASLQSPFMHQERRYEETNGKPSTILSNIEANNNLSTNDRNITSLQPSSVPKKHINRHKNGNSREMCMELATSDSDIGEHERMSNQVISNAISENKQNESSRGSKMQVKPNNSSKTKFNGNGSRYLSVLEKIRLFRQKLEEDLPSPSHNKIIKNGNMNNSSNSEFASFPDLFPEFDFSEIHLKYTKVESLVQRSQYVKDFNDEYEEYLKLQTEMKEISEKFSSLFGHLNESTEGSLHYKKIKFEIGEEYRRTSKNSYIASRKRFEFLRTKLSHIRELIQEYDENL